MSLDFASIIRQSIHYDRVYKTIFLMICDFGLLFVALAGSFVLRLERLDVLSTTEVVVPGLISASLGVASLWLLGVYRRVLRFQGRDLAYRIFFCAVLVGFCSLSVSFFGGIWMPRSIPIIQFVLSVWLLVVFRFGLKVMIELSFQGRGVNAVIYGAGSTGSRLAKGLINSEKYNISGFIDDDPSKQKTYISGYPVWSRSGFLLKHKGSRLKVLVAIPRITTELREEIIHALNWDGASIHFLPTYEEMVVNQSLPRDTESLDLDDLIEGRDIYNQHKNLNQGLAGKRILVSGGGGSIGSELVKQCFVNGPEALCVVDLSEPALHGISQEIESLRRVARGTACQCKFLLGSLIDRDFVMSLVSDFRPDIIYHAAAYKHVPLGEGNVFQMSKNNILGTANLIDAAMQNGAVRFVLVSSDKAVRPSNVMGATKQIAEKLVLSKAGKSNGVEFAIVRFGNVLGSSGSVVPIFNSQISKGGPVRVTHPDVTRYFMTITEAVGLVIEAGLMGSDKVYVLDMGEPVRIIDLAKRLIALRDLQVKDQTNPNGDIAIEFTGLREGEKMYEELFISENAASTANPKIFSESPSPVDYEALEAAVGDLSSSEIMGRDDVIHLFASVGVTINRF